MNLKNLLHGTIDIVFARRFGMEDLYGECPARNRISGSVSVEAGELVVILDNISVLSMAYLVSIHSCRRYDEFQISSPCENCEVMVKTYPLQRMLETYFS